MAISVKSGTTLPFDKARQEPIALKMAEMAVTLKRLTGQSVSRTGDYVKAPPEVIEEFLTHPKGL